MKDSSMFKSTQGNELFDAIFGEGEVSLIFIMFMLSKGYFYEYGCIYSLWY